MPVFLVDSYKPLIRNTLRGFVRVTMPSGLAIRDVTIHEQNGSRWASPPSKPVLNADRAIQRDPNGKIRYAQMIEFATAEARSRWSAGVVQAVERAFPDAFGAAP
jgi:hypothetical protein